MDQDLNVRSETVKLPQEGIGKTLEHTGIDKDFLNRTPITQKLRERIDKWGIYQAKKLLHSKRNSPYTKKTPYRMEENLRQLYKGLISRIHRELQKSNPTKNQQPYK
jgi:hypothetical protein